MKEEKKLVPEHSLNRSKLRSVHDTCVRLANYLQIVQPFNSYMPALNAIIIGSIRDPPTCAHTEPHNTGH
jgi:hypothetical protein